MLDNKWGVYAFFFILVSFITVMGSILGGHADSEWYQTLYKPGFTPPNFVFMVVWPILYVLLALAGARIYLSKREERKSALNVWLAMLLATGVYSYLFFKLESPVLGFIDTLVSFLLGTILLLKSFRIDKGAFYCLIPYVLWVSFAVVLSFMIMVHPMIA